MNVHNAGSRGYPMRKLRNSGHGDVAAESGEFRDEFHHSVAAMKHTRFAGVVQVNCRFRFYQRANAGFA